MCNALSVGGILRYTNVCFGAVEYNLTGIVAIIHSPCDVFDVAYL